MEVVVEHPRPSAELNFIPDIPLWVRIYVNNDTTPRCGRHCFELFLDGESQTITCERDTILDGVTPQPGIPLPLFLSSSIAVVTSVSHEIVRF